MGPLKESFLVYNSQGNSKGMAVVTFQRPGDALAAQAKYDGKIVDGRELDWPPVGHLIFFKINECYHY